MALRGLSEKIIVITGAAQGIGRATASRLIAEGCRVLAVDLDEEKLGALASSLGERLRPLKCDVSDETAWEDLGGPRSSVHLL